MEVSSVYLLMFRNMILSSLQSPLVADSLLHCSLVCTSKSNCYSFFYNEVNNECLLCDGFVSLGGNGTEPKSNVAYYGKISPAPTCPTDTGFQLETRFNICYKLHWEMLDFTVGRGVCQGEGADLATVKTIEIENFYIELLNTHGNDMFFGATDEGSPGVWRWMDGTSWPAFTVSIPDKHCLEYDNYGFLDGDYCEDKPQGFVCEVVLPPNYE